MSKNPFTGIILGTTRKIQSVTNADCSSIIEMSLFYIKMHFETFKNPLKIACSSATGALSRHDMFKALPNRSWYLIQDHFWINWFITFDDEFSIQTKEITIYKACISNIYRLVWTKKMIIIYVLPLLLNDLVQLSW